MATKEFKKWSRDVKREIKRLEKAGDYEQAAWLANAHAGQVIGMFA